MASSAASCVTNACEEAPNGRPDGPEAYEAAPAAVATLSDDERERFYQMLDSLPIDGPVPTPTSSTSAPASPARANSERFTPCTRRS